MNLNPSQFSDEGVPRYEEDFDLEREPVLLMPTFSGEVFRQHVQYGIIVEGWGKAVGPPYQTCGRIRRAWEQQFTEKERRILGRWHYRFHNWLFRDGTPLRVALRMTTLLLLQRAVAFFATV